jgi:REP element-mobilizing transposase RayT
MASTPRILYKGAAYHVTVRAVDGRPLFLDDVFRIAFLGRVEREVDERGWICDAYCLMTNHFHLLLRTPKEGLPEGMQRLNTWLATTYNRYLGRRGRVLESPYGALLIEKERHLLGVARYLPLNPLRAGMVTDPGDYEWSSFRATAGLAAPPRLLTTDWLLARLGGPDRYRAFVDAGRPVRSIREILLEP